jgi:septal ring factor EnvC (AmiA/AmiB activator)
MVALLPILAACGGSELTVMVLAGEGDELQPVADLPIELLPFNRDSVFEMLAAQAEEPEPQIPADLRAQFDSVAAMQEVWRATEAEWAEAREALQNLSGRLQRLDRRSREYQQLYRQFDGLESTERRLNNTRQQAFQAFDELQRQTLGRADSVRAVTEAWEDIAFMDYMDIEAETRFSSRAATPRSESSSSGHIPRTGARSARACGSGFIICTTRQRGDMPWLKIETP